MLNNAESIKVLLVAERMIRRNNKIREAFLWKSADFSVKFCVGLLFSVLMHDRMCPLKSMH